MSEIEKAIKACKEEIKFYKDELKQPYLKEYKTTYDAYISGQNEAYANCVNGIEIFEFIISILQEQQKQMWIPVSERLPGNPNPEDGEPKAYLVTINKFAIVPTTLYYMGDGRWVREWDEPSEIYTNILAWRPLPEPYKEGSHE